MGCTWQPLCFIRLQQLLIRLRRAQIGASHSCPEPQPVRGGGGCCGLCWCRLELLGGEWCLGFSVYCRVLARGSPKSSSRAGCAAEQSPVLGRGQCHTGLVPCPCSAAHGAAALGPEGLAGAPHQAGFGIQAPHPAPSFPNQKFPLRRCSRCSTALFYRNVLSRVLGKGICKDKDCL